MSRAGRKMKRSAMLNAAKAEKKHEKATLVRYRAQQLLAVLKSQEETTE